jgi:hypothetical protein
MDVPPIDDFVRDLRTLVERAHFGEFIEKVLKKEQDTSAQLEPIVSDVVNRFERDRLTFGEQSPGLEDEIAAPRLEKSSSMIGDLLLERQQSEEKDIPLLRAVSENPMKSNDVLQTKGGFSLSKPGMAKTPIKATELGNEDSFGRKDSITRVFNHFHMKSSEKKFPKPFDDHDRDIEQAAKNLERALEGQL